MFTAIRRASSAQRVLPLITLIFHVTLNSSVGCSRNSKAACMFVEPIKSP
jgi:hypothetical protein